MAMVSHSVWEEEGSLLWHDCKFKKNPKKNNLVFGINSKRMCCYGITHILSLFIVGNTLHDPNHLCQEQPDHFLPGLHGCRCERGGSFPPALVS